MKSLSQLSAKHRMLLSTVCAIILTLSWPFSRCLAQGSLTPSGAPAPTFKTLSQVEPRFPIANFQTNLTIPGSYYLVTNLYSGTNNNDAINIRTNMSNITIDLNGFTIISTNPAGGPSPAGVRISEATNIVIRNGQFAGFDRAIRAEGAFYGVVVENVHISGCRRAGIEATGFPTATMTIRNCVIEGLDGAGEGANVAVDGIALVNCAAVVKDCVVRDIVSVGTGVSSCIAALFCTNTFIDNNFLANAGYGIRATGSGTRIHYRNNLTAGVTNAFSLEGGVDRGGNF